MSQSQPSPETVGRENEALIRALGQPDREGNPAALGQIADAFLVARLMLLAGPEGNEGVYTVMDAELQAPVVPVFTDIGALQAFDAPEADGIFIVDGPEVAATFASAPGEVHLVLNPGNPHAFFVPAAMVRELAARGDAHGRTNLDDDALRGATVSLPARQLPAHVNQAIREVAPRHSEIVSCHLLQWQVPGRHGLPAPVLVFGIDARVPEAEHTAVVSLLWNELAPVFGTLPEQVEGAILNGMPELFGPAVRAVPPLYARDAA